MLRLFLFLLLLAGAAAAQPPDTRAADQVDVYHGVTVQDPYRWLEDADAPEVLEWVDLQNAYTREHLEGTPVRSQLVSRLTELWNYPRYSAPSREAGRYFYFKNDGLQDQSVLYYREGLEGEPQVLIDPNALSADGTTALSAVEISRDGRLAAYAVSFHGSDWQQIRVRDVASGRDYDERLEWAKFTSLAWSPDNRGFFYTRFPDPTTVAPEDKTNFNRVYYHRVGTPQSEDVLVFRDDQNKQLAYSPFVTEDGAYLVLSVWDGTDPRTRIYVRPVGETGEFQRFLNQADAAYEVVGNDGSLFYVKTDKDAPRGRLVAIDLARPEEWKTVIPEGPDVIDFVARVAGTFVVARLHDAHHQVALHDVDGRRVGEIPLPTVGSVRSLTGKNADREMFLGFESYLFPTTIYRYTFDDGKLAEFVRPEIDFPVSDYETTISFAQSRDGTRVPVFVTARKGLEKDGDNPTLLYGYGGFNVNMTPRFSIARLAWLDQGGVLAVAVLRGGSEYGEEWHQAGMLANKQNVFDDFIAAAEHLIAEGYTRPERLAINGGSNGGLLVAACMVQRPDLFGAVLCQVPVIDMLRYHTFTVGRYWIPEYGSADDPEQFKFLYAYSPLHNLKPGTKYPATLITSADTDDRVVPAHAKKFAAALQKAQGGEAPILLRVETKAGHGAGKPTSKQIEEAADLFTFLLKYLRVKGDAERGAGS